MPTWPHLRDYILLSCIPVQKAAGTFTLSLGVKTCLLWKMITVLTDFVVLWTPSHPEDTGLNNCSSRWLHFLRGRWPSGSLLWIHMNMHTHTHTQHTPMWRAHTFQAKGIPLFTHEIPTMHNVCFAGQSSSSKMEWQTPCIMTGEAVQKPEDGIKFIQLLAGPRGKNCISICEQMIINGKESVLPGNKTSEC